MHHHPWLLIFCVYIALQIPLGILVGSFCAMAEEEDGASCNQKIGFDSEEKSPTSALVPEA
jgi:hypothetical protein